MAVSTNLPAPYLCHNRQRVIHPRRLIDISVNQHVLPHYAETEGGKCSLGVVCKSHPVSQSGSFGEMWCNIILCSMDSKLNGMTQSIDAHWVVESAERKTNDRRTSLSILPHSMVGSWSWNNSIGSANFLSTTPGPTLMIICENIKQIHFSGVRKLQFSCAARFYNRKSSLYLKYKLDSNPYFQFYGC